MQIPLTLTSKNYYPFVIARRWDEKDNFQVVAKFSCPLEASYFIDAIAEMEVAKAKAVGLELTIEQWHEKNHTGGYSLNWLAEDGYTLHRMTGEDIEDYFARLAEL